MAGSMKKDVMKDARGDTKTWRDSVKESGASGTLPGALQQESPMMKAAKAFQQKLRRKSSTSDKRGTGKTSSAISREKENNRKSARRRTGPKGKSYRSRSDRDVVDRRDPKEVLKKNLQCDSKKGGRNTKTAFSMRNCYKFGSDVFAKPRPDRVYNADCDGWPH